MVVIQTCRLPRADIEAGKIGINLQEDVLGQIFGVSRIPGKPVAKPIDTPVVRADQLGPCAGIPVHAAADNLGPVDLQRSYLRARRASPRRADERQRDCLWRAHRRRPSRRA